MEAPPSAAVLVKQISRSSAPRVPYSSSSSLIISSSSAAVSSPSLGIYTGKDVVAGKLGGAMSRCCANYYSVLILWLRTSVAWM